MRGIGLSNTSHPFSDHLAGALAEAPPASQFVMMTAAWPLVAVELGGAHDEPACRGSAARGPRVRRRGPSDRALGLDLHVRILRHRDGGFDQEVRAMGSLKITVSLLVLAVETVNAKEGEWSAMVVQHPLRLSPDECLISLFWSHDLFPLSPHLASEVGC